MPDQNPPSPVGALVSRGMFAYQDKGDGHAPIPVERQMVCGCGRAFTQSLMADSELESMARMGVLDAFLHQIPDGYVPVYCPSCERKDLRRLSGGTYSPTVPDQRGAA